MKDFFKKHGLVKIIGISIIITLILTWIIPTGYFNGAEFVSEGAGKMGLSELFASGTYSISYFLLQVTFLLVLGGFYGLLSKVPSYKNLVERLSNWVKGKEVIFVLLVSLLISVYVSFGLEMYPILVFIPFIYSVIVNAKMDKLTAFCATFGAIMIGLIGATFAGGGFAYIHQYLGTTTTTLIWWRVGIFAAAYILFNIFTIINLRKSLSKKSDDAKDDLFAVEVKEEKTKKKAKKSVWPVVIVFTIIFALVILGFISWGDSFKIEWFDTLHNNLMTNKDGNATILASIVGSIAAFGRWDVSILQSVLIFVSIILCFMTKQSFDENLEAIGEGMKKMLKPVVMVILINGLFVLVYWSPIVPAIVNWFMNLTESFNVFFAAIAGVIASIFNVDYSYTGYTVGSYLSTFESSKDILLVVMNSTYGLVQFLAPTSLVLMIGLSYTDIKYSTWFKHIWKFMLGMLAVLLIVFALIAF